MDNLKTNSYFRFITSIYFLAALTILPSHKLIILWKLPKPHSYELTWLTDMTQGHDVLIYWIADVRTPFTRKSHHRFIIFIMIVVGPPSAIHGKI